MCRVVARVMPREEYRYNYWKDASLILVLHYDGGGPQMTKTKRLRSLTIDETKVGTTLKVECIYIVTFRVGNQV